MIPGDPCQKCRSGIMERRSTRTNGLRRTRYLRCDVCGETGKQVTVVDSKGRDVIRSDNKVIECPCCHATIRV